jgi:2-haloacid dehalogenase
MTIRAIVFDAYGTLYDVQSVSRLATELCGDKGELVTQLWRLKQLEYTWLKSLMRDYEDFSAVTRAALEFSLAAVGIPAEPALCRSLLENYLTLDPYPEAAAALAALADYRLAILSNGSPATLSALVEASGFGRRFSDVISVDRVRRFKPDPACYALVESSLRVPADQVLFVSSNGFDIAGAKRHGFRAAMVARSAAVPPPVDSAIGPGEFYRLLRGAPEHLGYPPDWRIAKLTDLAPLVADLAASAPLQSTHSAAAAINTLTRPDSRG